MKPGMAIAVVLCVAAAFCILGVLAFLAFMVYSCGYLDSGSTIRGPSLWYNYSVGNASYVVIDIYCATLGKNEINIVRSGDPGHISIEAIHGSLINSRSSGELYDDILQVGIHSSYGSDMYYGGARLNVYLPEGPAYDIMISSHQSTIRVGNFSGTNLVIKNDGRGDLTIDGGDYDYVYADNGGSINGQFRANKSMLKAGNGRVNVVTPKP